MISTVTSDNQVTIPAELAREFNVMPGTQLDWSKGEDGTLRAKPVMNRAELARSLAGIGRQWLSPDDDPIAGLIHERCSEDAR